MAKLDIYPIRFNKSNLDAASKEERLFHLLVGQAANDLNIIAKLVIARDNINNNEIEQSENAVIGIYLIRQFSSRIYEVWKTFQTHFPKIYRLYEGQWEDDGEKAWKSMRDYFNTRCLIGQIRSKVGFHSDIDAVSLGYDLLNDDEKLVDYMGVASGNALYASSNDVLTLAMVHIAGIEDRASALDKILNDVLEAYSWINDLTLKYFTLFALKYIANETDAEKIISGKLSVDAPSVRTLNMRFFLDYTKNQA